MTPTVQSVLDALREQQIEPVADDSAGPGSHRAHCPACGSALFTSEAPPLLISQNGAGPKLICTNGCAPEAILVELGLSAPPQPVAGTRGEEQLRRIALLPKHNETDMGNARRLVFDHREDLQYAVGLGWLENDDGVRYARDVDGAAMRRAKATVRRILDEAHTMYEAADAIDDEGRRASARKAADARLTHAKRSQAQPRIEAMLKCASTEREFVVAVDQLDSDPFLLNAPNGTVELRTGELREHRRADRLTKIAGAPFDPSMPTPAWDAYLQSTFGGDRDLIAYVQRALGYTATGDTSEQCIFLAVGDGQNGKTTGLATVAAALGDYAITVDPVTFTTGVGDRAARSDIARTAGARKVWGSETDAGAHLALSLIKQYSGGDPIVARFLYQPEFEFTPVGKIWLSVNHPPRIGDDGHAIWRRIRVIPFDVRIAKPDKHLGAKLRAELPGIVAWIVQGAAEWQRRGLGTCAAVERATAAYRKREDRIGQFLAECCELDPDARTENGELRRALEAWERAHGRKPADDLAGRLFDRLKRDGCTPAPSNGKRGYRGIRVVSTGAGVTGSDG